MIRFIAFTVGLLGMLPIASAEAPEWFDTAQKITLSGLCTIGLVWYFWRIEPRYRETLLKMTTDFAQALKDKDEQHAEALLQQRTDFLREIDVFRAAVTEMAGKQDKLAGVTLLHVGQAQRKWDSDDRNYTELKNAVLEGK